MAVVYPLKEGWGADNWIRMAWTRRIPEKGSALISIVTATVMLQFARSGSDRYELLYQPLMYCTNDNTTITAVGLVVSNTSLAFFVSWNRNESSVNSRAAGCLDAVEKLIDEFDCQELLLQQKMSDRS